MDFKYKRFIVGRMSTEYTDNRRVSTKVGTKYIFLLSYRNVSIKIYFEEDRVTAENYDREFHLYISNLDKREIIIHRYQ